MGCVHGLGERRTLAGEDAGRPDGGARRADGAVCRSGRQGSRCQSKSINACAAPAIGPPDVLLHDVWPVWSWYVPGRQSVTHTNPGRGVSDVQGATRKLGRGVQAQKLDELAAKTALAVPALQAAKGGRNGIGRVSVRAAADLRCARCSRTVAGRLAGQVLVGAGAARCARGWCRRV